ncbi:MAG TPA: hypothetical protein DCS55_10845 [Acidimicrobiaceae bacterium]|nr:hypothetical protein [Acidimicrobiaceae bacterium]
MSARSARWRLPGEAVARRRGVRSCAPHCRVLHGIVIFLPRREHGVPHFHARHGDPEAVVAIDTEVLTGDRPRTRSEAGC